ncbi:retinal homeobox protein Rx1-like [Dendronephthya gigantea]|uniref:retinal homeobox protein Rx1-like n=1 Tax=Dendronephthya gigantea TaxID=151771 RepID=UPI0010699867|nr:retinal homeobox protein Rx1-like [Dendronephthya gigantea]
MTTCCLNWEDCRMCDPEIGGSHLVGYEARPESGFFESRGKFAAEEMKPEEVSTQIAGPRAGTNDQGKPGTRRRRATYRRWQVDILEEAFEVNCYPSTWMKRFLAARLDMENIQVQVWFQNRRARMKKDVPSPYARNYPLNSLPSRLYPRTTSYIQYNPTHIPYDAAVLTSINTRRSPFTHVPRYPVVTPMFSRLDLDRVLYRQPYPRHACSPRTQTSSPRQADDNVTPQGYLNEKNDI